MVERHPSPGWCALEIGVELVQGTDCHAYPASHASVGWLVVKIGGQGSFCRAAPAKISGQFEAHLPGPEKGSGQFVVHLVAGEKLDGYLNGGSGDGKTTDMVRPPEARLVSLFQEARPDPFFGGTFYSYRVIWERQ